MDVGCVFSQIIMLYTRSFFDKRNCNYLVGGCLDYEIEQGVTGSKYQKPLICEKQNLRVRGVEGHSRFTQSSVGPSNKLMRFKYGKCAYA